MEKKEKISLLEEFRQFPSFGQEHIEEGAFRQMETAIRLPVAVKGALMPDAHQGYGLPIGGVLATEGVVIPYGVGVDIGCRMCLSVFDLPVGDLEEKKDFFSRELGAATLFGAGSVWKEPDEHAVLDRIEFNEFELLRKLKDRAWKQLGTSGSGNHFVEFGIVEIGEKDAVWGLEAGQYIGLLSHSGSRGLGASIASHYTKLAMELRPLVDEAKHLSWLDLKEQEGMEYWTAMNLAGDYASACHHIIHQKIAKQLGCLPVSMVENHHNFAWKEWVDGKECIVHRKGATPAGKDVMGIIPGSMTASGFIVKGKGAITSLESAAHGAGRKMSRSAVLKNFTQEEFKEELKKHGVKLMGGGLDEAPFAYKDIHQVMLSQQELVELIGRFIPRIVKMDSGGRR